MHKLGALDAGFLYNETENCPQNIASVQVLELPEGQTVKAFVADLKALLLERSHLVPYFTNRLQFVPFNLDHPVWVRDEKFDIDNHVHTTEIAAPGDLAALEAKIAELHERRLDRSRPLWDLWVLTGLEGGRVAYYNRAHHACLDGVAGQAMIEAIMDLTPEPRRVDAPAAAYATRRDTQNAAQLIAGALENFAGYQSRQPLAWLKGMETTARMFQRAFDPRKGLGAVIEGAPRVRFNKAIDRGRTYAAGEIELVDVKKIARLTETKVNDIFLASCAGGLRRYFERRGELPDTSLVAGCPVSLRQSGDTPTGNQVTMMLVSLGTDDSDAAQRLQKIAGSARTAKGFTADIAPSFDAEIAVPGLPGLLSAGIGMAERAHLADLPGLRLPCNVVVSNVPGPQFPLYSCGAKVLTHYPVSIPAHTQGANITVQSYDGKLFFGITACAKALPDANVLRDDMLAAFAELKALYVPQMEAILTASTTAGSMAVDAGAAAQQKASKSRASAGVEASEATYMESSQAA